MRHAYLIIAHNNWWQLRKLIECLDYDTHDIYVHIDKKSKDFDKEYFKNATLKSKLTFYTEYEVFWGGYSQVEVEMFLLEKAYQEHYDYYHIISGADLPLYNNIEIDNFFENNKGKEFISFDDKSLNENPEITRRTKYYHFLHSYRRRYKEKWKNSFFTFCERILLIVQIIMRVNRVKKLDWKIKFGSNWVSITDNLVKEVLNSKDKIKNVFMYTNSADELFVQTVAFNNGFSNRIYHPDIKQNANMRLIDWERGKNGNPYTFEMVDLDMLKQNKNLFARKFSETVDREVIIQLISIVNNK